MKITIEAVVQAPLQKVWDAYTSPEDIMQWNKASPDWQATDASVDLREGGVFYSRMEAKDGSSAFDFTGICTKVVPMNLIEYLLGDRVVSVAFTTVDDVTTVRTTFDAEANLPEEQQRAGWQSILDSFAAHVAAKS